MLLVPSLRRQTSALVLVALLCCFAATSLAHKTKATVLLQTQKGVVEDISSDIKKLDSALEADQQKDSVTFYDAKTAILDNITKEETLITQDKEVRQKELDRLVVYRSERLKIENIYGSDKQAYQTREQSQAKLVAYISELIDQTEKSLLNNPNVPSQDSLALLAEIKQIGHDRPVEAFAQMMRLFNKSDAKDLVDRFNNLLKAVQQSQSIDYDKETSNRDLYAKLTSNLDDVLIPNTLSAIANFNSSIKSHRKNIADLNIKLQQITTIYNARKNERSKAVAYEQDAQVKLDSGIKSINLNGVVVTSNAV